MDWYQGIRRAFEIDLEEIRLMAEAARTAPGPVAHSILMIMMDELMEAMHWHMMLMMRPGNLGFGESQDDYNYEYPTYGTPYTTEDKEEKDK